MGVPVLGREAGAIHERTSPVRTIAAGLLVACYAVACAWSLWSRVHAIEFFALASVASAGFVIVSSTGRVVAGILADLLASGVAVVLPGIGEVADAIAAVVAVSVMSRKFLRFLKTLPYGLACCGLYLGLWSTGRHISSAFGTEGEGHPAAFRILTAVLVTIGGLLYLFLITRLALWAGGEWTAAVFYTIGYPWVLLMFVVTYFIPDASRHEA
ncbi:hypothetical protein ABIA33_000585 [Streptacidiphilus sp. MAP12-16]|uniref:hypothetical protein n=1 Tax=Streptacidiphilus sp. MAP12-16 TaxID=3156300 RepID=UPI003511D6D8